jgi:hypothetical protein
MHSVLGRGFGAPAKCPTLKGFLDGAPEEPIQNSRPDRLKLGLVIGKRFIQQPQRTLSELRRELTGDDSSSQMKRNQTQDASIFVKSLLGWDSWRGSGRAVE